MMGPPHSHLNSLPQPCRAPRAARAAAQHPFSTESSAGQRGTNLVLMREVKSLSGAGGGGKRIEGGHPAGSEDFSVPQSTFPSPFCLSVVCPQDPMEHLQMAKQEEMGRKGREARPGHGVRGRAEGRQDCWPRLRGRDSCCGGGGLRRERNSLETALSYTRVSHRSCPWNLPVGGRSRSLWGPGRNGCRKRDPSLGDSPSAPSTVPAPSRQDRGAGLGGTALHGVVWMDLPPFCFEPKTAAAP